ncbi:MAG: cation:proton antiporter, partial [Bacteroidales bacterium]|nr:cation:proton antiporter [Bacteroidales bacterium]MCF8338869.1 cation:proton antiporter [Bacteroidales bacterium]
NTHEIEMIAEVGVILLLFTIGIEFSFKKLQKIRRTVLLGGALQVGLTILLTFFLTRQVGLSWSHAVFAGFLVSLSSTAVVLKIIQNRGEIATHHGQTSLGVLIFQDIIIVPMMLFLPFLAGSETEVASSILTFAGKVVLIISLTYIGAKYVIPWVLLNIARTQSRELFMIVIILFALAIAWFTSQLGLSLALGAFIAGLIISESEYSEQAFGNIMPFRDVFTSFFFVSIGMLLNLDYVINHLPLVLSLTAAVLFLKAFVSGFTTFLLGFPFRTTVIVGLTLSQIGEFSFILSKLGMDYELLSQDYYQAFLAVSVITMSLTPFIIAGAPHLADFILRFRIPGKIRCGLANYPETEETKQTNHLIIVGYGINGRNVAKAAEYADIPHTIIEMNPDTVRQEQEKGKTIHYGDATQGAVLHKANIDDALILVITLPHAGDVKRITQSARSINPQVYIIIRIRFVNDMKALYKAGADEVIPEEYETSIEIFSRVLTKYLVPKDTIEQYVSQVRSDNYEIFRSLSLPANRMPYLQVQAPNVEIHAIHVGNHAHIIGKKIGEVEFMNEEGLTLLAISREGEIIKNPDDEIVLKADDILFFLGSKSKIGKYFYLFKDSESDKN